MAYEQRDNSGSLFRNTDKKSDKHPDYSGTAMIDGTEMYMDAWIKESENGRKWMSFSFKPKQKQQPTREPSRQERAAKYRPGVDDDGLPPF